MDLRPLTLGELLDRSFSIYRRHFWLFVGIMAVPSIVMLLVSVGLQFLQPPNPDTPDAAPETLEFVSFLLLGGLLTIIGVIVYWISYAIATGAATVAVSQLYRQEQITIAGAYEPVRGQAVDIAFLLLLIGLRVGGLMFALVLLVILMASGSSVISPILSVLIIGFGVLVVAAVVLWMTLRYSVAVPALVLEGTTASDAIRRSVDLTRGHLGRVFVIVIFCFIVAYAALGIFQGPFVAAAAVTGAETATGFWLNLAGVIAGSVASAFTGPLVIIALAVLYYDLRIRKEGLDLQLMISDLGRQTPETPAALPG